MNINQEKPFHDNSCFLVAENVIDDFEIGFREFFLPNSPRVDTQEDHDKREADFLKDRYKMLYYAFSAGYKCNQSQFRRVVKIVSIIHAPDIIRDCIVKIITLMLYFRLGEDSEPFFKNFSLLYNIECVLKLRSKLPQKVLDMVILYEKCWEDLLLLYCWEKRFQFQALLK